MHDKQYLTPNDSRTRGKNRFYPERSKTDTYGQSFFPKTIRDLQLIQYRQTQLKDSELPKNQALEDTKQQSRAHNVNCKLEIVLKINSIERTCCVARCCEAEPNTF